MSTQPISVERDAEGQILALRELFEESYLAEVTGGFAQKLDDETRERMLDDMPQRTLSPGYYSRAAYLLDLASAIERGATYPAGLLARSDVEGLEALKRAKGEFESDHPACGSCGWRQESRWAIQCGRCKTKFMGAN